MTENSVTDVPNEYVRRTVRFRVVGPALGQTSTRMMDFTRVVEPASMIPRVSELKKKNILIQSWGRNRTIKIERQKSKMAVVIKKKNDCNELPVKTGTFKEGSANVFFVKLHRSKSFFNDLLKQNYFLKLKFNVFHT